MPPQHHCYLALLALTLAASTGARAEGADELHLRALVGVVHDSNLFRLSDSANIQALIGRSSAAETIGIKTLGLNYNKAYSLQRVEFDASVNDYSYTNFSYLNFIAYNYNAAWRWSYTPRLHGSLTTARDQSLNSFVDFTGFNQRNVRVNGNSRADATYELDANWRLLGGLSKAKLSNSQQLTQEPDFNSTSADAGLRYVLPSGSSAAYTFKSTDGTYSTNRPIPSPGFYDNAFTQTDNDLLLTWAISSDTSVSVNAGYRSRKHPNYPQRDFSGMTGGANLNWSISPKSAIVAGWTRDLATYETSISNFTQTDRFSVGPVWQVSPKATVRLNLDYTVRDFRGTPQGPMAVPRRDTSRDASLSFDWQPVTYLVLNASLQNARRASNLPGLGYTSNMINLTAQFTY